MLSMFADALFCQKNACIDQVHIDQVHINQVHIDQVHGTYNGFSVGEYSKGPTNIVHSTQQMTIRTSVVPEQRGFSSQLKIKRTLCRHSATDQTQSASGREIKFIHPDFRLFVKTCRKDAQSAIHLRNIFLRGN